MRTAQANYARWHRELFGATAKEDRARRTAPKEDRASGTAPSGPIGARRPEAQHPMARRTPKEDRARGTAPQEDAIHTPKDDSAIQQIRAQMKPKAKIRTLEKTNEKPDDAVSRRAKRCYDGELDAVERKLRSMLDKLQTMDAR